MIKKTVIAVLLVLFLVMPVVFADTTINVNTLPNSDVILKTLDPNPREGESNLLEYFRDTSDKNGKVSFQSITKKLLIDIVVIVEKDGVRKKINGKTIHKFEEKITGGVINLEVKEKPPEPEPEVNETEVNKTEKNETEETNETTGNMVDVNVEVTNETKETEEQKEPETKTNTTQIKEEKTGITGAVVSGTKAVVTSKITYYVIGGIFILGVLFFVIFIARKKLKGKATYIDFKIKNNKDSVEDKKDELDDKIEIHDKKILKIERTIEEAKKELDEIKNRKSKLQEARERFERDKAELERLERD